MSFSLVLRILCAGCFLCASVSGLPAQNGLSTDVIDGQIHRFSSNGPQDSLMYYSNRKASIARQADDLATWGWVQYDLQDYFAGNNARELQHLNDALKNRWRTPGNAQEWEPFLYLQAGRGWLLSQTGQIWQAVQDYESAGQLYERFRYPDFEAVEMIYKPLGNHYTRLGDNEKALAVFQKALTAGGDPETRAGLYCNIGIAHWNQGDFTTAEVQLNLGLALKGISAAKRGLLLSALAQVQLDKGQAGPAYRTAREVLRVFDGGGNPDGQVRAYRARTRRTAGEAAAASGHPEEAKRLLLLARKEAIAAFGAHSRDVGKTNIALSNLSLQQHNPFPALDYANAALTAVLPGFRPHRPEDNPDKSLFYEENVIFEALQAKAAAAQLLFEQHGDLRYLEIGLGCHDLAWQAETDLRKVFQYSSSKLTLQQETRTRDESAIHLARMLYEKTGKQGYLEKAFEIAERSKASLLLDALQENRIRRRLAGSDPRFDQVALLRRSLMYYQRNLILDPENDAVAQWRAEADALTGQIAVVERAMAADYSEPGNSTAAAKPGAPDCMAEGEILLEYFAGEQFIDVFVRQRGSQDIWKRIPRDVRLDTLAHNFLAFFSDANAMLNAPVSYLETAYALWQIIVPPEAAQARKLLIVPDGFLCFIPFEALVTGAGNDRRSLRNAGYLIRTQEVRYAWSLATLSSQHALVSAARGYFLAFAPGFAKGERGLAPLTGSEWYPASVGNAQVLEGSNADLDHFLREGGGYRILHFSTHAFADSVPRIELYDQPMLLPDIYALPLHADLVVLSACQTGLGRFQKGEGVMSLARAFAQSGAACTLSSLWAVNDLNTARLLRQFYENMERGEALGEALRRAKLDYLEDRQVNATFQTPFFWAGFTLVGDDRPIEGKGAVRAMYWLVVVLLLAVVFFILHQNSAQKRS
ncbi:MAG: CHAT domain-containing protein [Lewinellaceae bacterium]|nr:CHAT domain-containing protein [Lewinellaceae bacterium]